MTAMNLKTHMRMSRLPLVLCLIASAASAQAAGPAGSEREFKSAYAAAESAESEAARLRNRWTVTELALADARRASDRGDFDHAIASAREAERLAKASIFQATSEKDAWKNVEIH